MTTNTEHDADTFRSVVAAARAAKTTVLVEHHVKAPTTALNERIAELAGEQARLRTLVLLHYGPRCACGERDDTLLGVGHVDDRGAARFNDVGLGFYRWVVDHDYPDSFYVVCRRCDKNERPCPTCTTELIGND